MVVTMVTTAFGQTPITFADFNANNTYRIYNKREGGDWKAIAPQDNLTGAYMKAYDASDESTVWKFIPEGEGYYIQNVKTQKYLAGVYGNGNYAYMINGTPLDGCVRIVEENESYNYGPDKNPTKKEVYFIEQDEDGVRIELWWGTDKGAKSHWLWHDTDNCLFGWQDDVNPAGHFYLELVEEGEAPVTPPATEEPDVTVSQFPADRIVTQLGDGFETIKFSEEVAYTAPAEGIKILKNGEFFSDVTIYESKQKNTFMIYFPGTKEPGVYTVTFPEGCFKTLEDQVIPEVTLTWEIETPVASWEAIFDEKYNEFRGFTINISNATEVTLDNEVKPFIFFAGAPVYGEVIPNISDGVISSLSVQFPKIKDEGTYAVTIPAGMFSLDGEDNEKKTQSITIAPAENPLAVESVKFLADGTLEIVYNQKISEAWGNDSQVLSKTIIIKNKAGEEFELIFNSVPEWPSIRKLYISKDSEYDYNNNVYNIVPLPYDEYSVDLSQIIVQFDYDEANYDYRATGSCDGIWTVVMAETAIEGVDAEAENAVIYDLTGRRIEKITNAGIYIVNGNKILVK